MFCDPGGCDTAVLIFENFGVPILGNFEGHNFGNFGNFGDFGHFGVPKFGHFWCPGHSGSSTSARIFEKFRCNMLETNKERTL